MIVTCNEKEKLEKTYACSGLDFGDNIIEVYAIAKFKINKVMYLLRFKNSVPRWFYSNFFDVLENKVPNYWISKTYGFFYSLKNKKYDFNIPIKTFWGPPEFIYNPNFLFDIYEEPSQADKFFLNVIEKYKHQDN